MAKKAIDEFLNETGANDIDVEKFLAYIEERPDHVWYPRLFGRSVEELAHAQRVAILRRLISSARAYVVSQRTGPTPVSVPVYVTTKKIVGDKRILYVPTVGALDEDSTTTVEPGQTEVRRILEQGATGLNAWLSRYRGTMLLRDLDQHVTQIEEIAAALTEESQR